MEPLMRPDFMRYVLSIAAVISLLLLSGWVLLPFMAAGVWSAMIVVATWPILLRLEKFFGGRRIPAAAVMTLGILCLLVVPLWVAITTVAEHSGTVVSLARQLAEGGLPLAPAWLDRVPFVGARLVDFWNEVAAIGAAESIQKYVLPHLSGSGQWLLGQIGGVGGVLIQFLLMTILAGVMYANGELAAELLGKIGRRIGGDRGLAAVVLSAKAIRSVALGVGLTAVIQSLLGTLGLMIAGIPHPAILGALMLFLCIAQIGPSLVLVPAVVWMFWRGEELPWAIFLAVWSTFVITIDNFLRPMLIRRGADLPLILILVGVIGGLLTFGLIGIFVGPVVLAVTYTLMMAWTNEELPEAMHEDLPESLANPLQNVEPGLDQKDSR